MACSGASAGTHLSGSSAEAGNKNTSSILGGVSQSFGAGVSKLIKELLVMGRELSRSFSDTGDLSNSDKGELVSSRLLRRLFIRFATRTPPKTTTPAKPKTNTNGKPPDDSSVFWWLLL